MSLVNLLKRARKRHLQWLWIAAMNALSRILETASMLLPVKAAFILVQPQALATQSLGFSLSLELLVLLMMGLVAGTMLASKVLQAYSRSRANQMHQHLESIDAETLSVVTMRVSSSLLVMLVFAILLLVIDWVSLLLIACLMPMSLVPWLKWLSEQRRQRLYRLFGIHRDAARSRFAGQILVLLFITIMLLLAVFTDQVSLMLVIVILVGRRFFQEYSRFVHGMHQRQRLKSGGKLEFDD